MSKTALVAMITLAIFGYCSDRAEKHRLEEKNINYDNNPGLQPSTQPSTRPYRNNDISPELLEFRDYLYHNESYV